MTKQLHAKDLYYLISFDVFRATEAGFALYGQREKTTIQFRTNAANSFAYSYVRDCIDLATIRVAEAVVPQNVVRREM
jgi:hypothetical protein